VFLKTHKNIILQVFSILSTMLLMYIMHCIIKYTCEVMRSLTHANADIFFLFLSSWWWPYLAESCFWFSTVNTFLCLGWVYCICDCTKSQREWSAL